MHPNADEYLGVDVGGALVGIARASGQARLAEPLMSVKAESATDTLVELAQKYQVAGIVIGLPRGLNGDETAQTRIVKQWAEQAKQSIGLPCYWQDEALTSQKAQSIKHKTEDSMDEHALAAAIILQDFLDTPVNNRVAL